MPSGSHIRKPPASAAKTIVHPPVKFTPKVKAPIAKTPNHGSNK
jgi:hypothetical protein